MATRSPLAVPVFPDPPRAKVIPHRLEQHGHVRVDDYYWLNDRSNPEVQAYLQKENDYATAMRRHTVDLEKKKSKAVSSKRICPFPSNKRIMSIMFGMKRERNMPSIAGKRAR
jgi:hypothetical protein